MNYDILPYYIICTWCALIKIILSIGLDGACVYVNGRECNPLVSDCIIAEANNVGVFVDNHAKVNCESCELIMWSLLWCH